MCVSKVIPSPDDSKKRGGKSEKTNTGSFRVILSRQGAIATKLSIRSRQRSLKHNAAPPATKKLVSPTSSSSSSSSSMVKVSTTTAVVHKAPMPLRVTEMASNSSTNDDPPCLKNPCRIIRYASASFHGGQRSTKPKEGKETAGCCDGLPWKRGDDSSNSSSSRIVANQNVGSRIRRFSSKKIFAQRKEAASKLSLIAYFLFFIA